MNENQKVFLIYLSTIVVACFIVYLGATFETGKKEAEVCEFHKNVALGVDLTGYPIPFSYQYK